MEEPSGMYHELEDNLAGMYPGPSGNLAPLLLVTTVDIGEGKSDRIEVRRGDVPMDVARDFVIKHGLPPAIIPRLAMHLEENLAKVAAQKQAANRGGRTNGGMDDNGDEVAVFHRLYEQAIALRHKLDEKRDMVKRSEEEAIRQSKTNMSWISSEMMRDRSSGPFENYGEMLYAESLESMAKRREKAERRRAEKQMEEVQGVTFKPEISRLAQNLWTPHECSQVPAWQRLSKVKMTKAQERLEMLRREKEEAEVKECTFKPQLNQRSAKLMTERSQTLRSLNVSAHQQLYQDAVRRQQKMQDYQHWYPEEVTFQPKLHESAMAREFLRKSLGPEAAMLSATGEERHKALVNRLYASYEKLQNKLQEARSTLQTSIDPATGKKLFCPETGRAPNFARHNGGQPVGEYLYGLKEQHELKIKAAAEEQERKRQEDAGRVKQSQGSKTMVKALQHKRFRQIFDFLDQEELGSINLVALLAVKPDWLDDLDDEVRADLEMAAKLLAKRSLKHNDSGKSDASFFMPPPPALDMEEAGSGGEGTDPSTPNATPGVVGFQHFCELMEEVLTTRRGPRTYLAPSPPRKYAPTETYKPQIDERSKQIASKIRPKDTPLHEFLYQESVVLTQKLNEKRARVEAERTASCTFAPQLVSQQIVKEGRVMKGVREGTWYTQKSDGGVLEGADSLQHLAAMMGEEPSQTGFEDYEPAAAAADSSATAAAAAESATNAAAAAAAAITAAVGGSAAEAAPAAAAASAAGQPNARRKSASPTKQKRNLPAGIAAQKKKQQERERLEEVQKQQEEELLQLQQEEEQERQAQLERLAQLQELEQQLQMFAQAEQQRYHEEQAAAQAAAMQAAAQQPPAQQGQQAAAEQAEVDDEFEGSEEQRQYLELEREVQQMLEATSAAAAAAERLQSATDQQYLSEILGLAQEQVDAMAPAISHLKGLEVNTSTAVSSEQPSACGSATAAAAAAALAAMERQYTPKSSFKVTMLEDEQPAAPAQQQQQQQVKKSSSKVGRKASSKLIDIDDMDLFELAGVNGPADNVSAGMGKLIIE